MDIAACIVQSALFAGLNLAVFNLADRRVHKPTREAFMSSVPTDWLGGDIGRLEATGAQNLLDLDDVPVTEEGEPVGPRVSARRWFHRSGLATCVASGDSEGR
jgi:hypothetical protein